MNRHSNFQVRVQPARGLVPRIVRVCGELDVAHTATLHDAVTGTRGDDVVLDLTLLSFIDAAGLGCVVGLHSLLRAEDRTLTIHATAARVVRVFTVTGLSTLLEPTPSPSATAVPGEPGVPSRSVTLGRPGGRLPWQPAMIDFRA